MSLKKSVRRVFRPLVLAVVFTSFLASFGALKAAGQDGIDRRVKSKINPMYPEIARKLGLAGTVKLEVTVAPNGTVKDTKVIGGNPILVNAAIDAMKRWKFEPGAGETVGVVEFKFESTN